MLLVLLQAANDSLLFRSDKIYTVLSVVLILWVGLVAYLLKTNRRISRLEKQLKDKLPQGQN